MIVLAVIMCILGLIGAFLFIIAVITKLGGGCLSIILGLLLFGGYIGGISGIGSEFGAPGVAIVSLVGIILGIIALFIFISSDSSYSSSSSSSSVPSISASMSAWSESRKNDPHTCGNCLEYSATKGECKSSGNSKSAEDSCSNWH